MGTSKRVIVGAAALAILFISLLVWNPRAPKPTDEASLKETPLPPIQSSEPAPLRQVQLSPPTPEGDFGAEVAVDFDWREAVANRLDPPKLPREEVDRFLERNQRNAASLLAAYHSLGDTNYLKEAAARFRDDPKVQLSVLARNLFPEERRDWLDDLKRSSPDNAVADYLSAADYFKKGESGRALDELIAASGKPGFEIHAVEGRLDEEELNLAAGRSSLHARLASTGWAEELTPVAATLKGLAQDMANWERQYLGNGDRGSAEHLAQIGMELARRLGDGDAGAFMVNQLLGGSVAAIVLGPLNPSESCAFLGNRLPGDILAEIHEQRASVRSLAQAFQDVVPSMTEAELLSYTERQKLYGELEAMLWLQQRRTTEDRLQIPE
ncbi:MAG: hypothetical protein AB9869_19380 [Verrucomicrobiia bacterium]